MDSPFCMSNDQKQPVCHRYICITFGACIVLSVMNQMFEVKTISNDLRNSNVLFQPKWQNVTYGKNTFKNYGNNIWNLLPNEIKKCTDIDKFKSSLKSWEGPKCQCTMCNALS